MVCQNNQEKKKKKASIGKITEKKMSGKYPWLINTKEGKEKRGRKIS